MDDTLLKYDQSLEALEKQRENLELVMKKMGTEWEVSGAGVGWMGDILYSNSSTTNTKTPLPLLLHSVTCSSEPSHDYLQTLLDVNDKLLVESLAFSSNGNNNTQLLKKSLFVSQHPSSQDEQLVAQFTAPITPD